MGILQHHLSKKEKRVQLRRVRFILSNINRIADKVTLSLIVLLNFLSIFNSSSSSQSPIKILYNLNQNTTATVNNANSSV